MSKFVAIINVPGYSPMDDDPPVFDTAREAWEYLAGERERGEEDSSDDPDQEYTDTARQLRTAAGFGIAAAEITYPNGTGVVYGCTPGSDSDHDLGLTYSVVIVNE
jgi:hypothetical protein